MESKKVSKEELSRSVCQHLRRDFHENFPANEDFFLSLQFHKDDTFMARLGNFICLSCNQTH